MKKRLFAIFSTLFLDVCFQRDPSDPEEAFRLWRQRKQEQQQKEKQLVELKRLEEDSSYLLRSREECEHAFKL